MKHPDETLYMYASARLHALERHMIGRERLEALLAEMYDTSVPFRKAGDEKTCGYCDFKMICGR